MASMSTGNPGVDSLIKLGCPESKAVNLPYFVPLPRLADRSTGPRGTVLFLSIGQLIERKGLDISIEAAAILRRRSSLPFKYLIVGTGPAELRLRERVARLGLSGLVDFLPWQEPAEVSNLLLRSDVFIHPARREPFGVVILEAMAHGLPVLGSAASGAVLDRIRNGENGYAHRTEDVGQLAEQMLTVLTDHDLMSRMGRAARRTAESWPVERGVQIIRRAFAP